MPKTEQSRESLEPLFGNKEKACKCVVRITTSCWSDVRGVHLRKSLTYLRKKSFGYNILDEDCSNAGAGEIIPRISNLDDVKDGIFEVVTCNESRDWETGIIDDYDYKLIPFNESLARAQDNSQTKDDALIPKESVPHPQRSEGE